MGERVADEEISQDRDYAAIGREVLEGLGVEDPDELGSISLNFGGDCVGTLAEAVGRHRTTLGEDAIETISAALKDGVDPVEAIAQDRSFKRSIVRDENGAIVKSTSGEELKKN